MYCFSEKRNRSRLMTAFGMVPLAPSATFDGGVMLQFSPLPGPPHKWAGENLLGSATEALFFRSPEEANTGITSSFREDRE